MLEMKEMQETTDGCYGAPPTGVNSVKSCLRISLNNHEHAQ
jgi:hypothetical protein